MVVNAALSIKRLRLLLRLLRLLLLKVERVADNHLSGGGGRKSGTLVDGIVALVVLVSRVAVDDVFRADEDVSDFFGRRRHQRGRVSRHQHSARRVVVVAKHELSSQKVILAVRDLASAAVDAVVDRHGLHESRVAVESGS